LYDSGSLRSDSCDEDDATTLAESDANDDVTRWISTMLAGGEDVFEPDMSIDDVTRDTFAIAQRQPGDVSWVTVVICHGGSAVRPLRLRRLTRVERRGGLVLRLAEDVDASLACAELPQVAQPPRTLSPKPFPVPSEELKQVVKAARLRFCDVFTSDEALAGWYGVVRRSNDDFEHRNEPSSSHRLRARFSKPSGEFRVSEADHHLLVRRCYREGIALRLEDDGFYQAVDLSKETLVHGFDGDALAQAAAVCGVEDREIMTAMMSNASIGGYRDHSEDTPCVSSFSVNQLRANEHFDGPNGLGVALDAEINYGCYGAEDGVWSTSPKFVPSIIVPLNQRQKKNGTSRLIGNRSAPVGYNSHIAADGSFCDDGGRPISSNANTDRSMLMMKSWLQIEHISEAVAVLATAAHATQLRLVGRVFDLERWFRQLATAVVDRRKVHFFVRNNYLADERDAMGGVSAADHGQRTTALIVAVLRHELLPEIAALIESAVGPQWERLRAWTRARVEAGRIDVYPFLHRVVPR
jgi:hypothetical protein